MKLNTVLALTIAAGALAACGGDADENMANMDANAGMTADEQVLPVDNMTNADTLGNQINALNTTDNATTNTTDNMGNATTNY